jgi:ATP-dependent helicase/nuclease subunit A
MFPDGIPEAAELSASLLSDFTRLGMVRKFREVREALKKIPDVWNDFTEERFADLIKCAAEFEDLRDETVRLSDFIKYVSEHKRRDFAEDGMVRIMTMHQSKGLGFDHVIVPFYEYDDLYGGRHSGPLKGENWILNNPSKETDATDSVLAEAERRRRQTQLYASLCLDYVALTRAKKALTIILHPMNKNPSSEPVKFSDLVRMVGLETAGDKEWYLKCKSREKDEKHDGITERMPIVRQKRVGIVKARPSESYITGLSADCLFMEDYGAAAEYGKEIHAKYEKIDWIKEDDAKDAFDRVFVRPNACTELWRERQYELFVDGAWESGQFDRVMFSVEEGNRKADIFDFKTNAMRPGESVEDYEERMHETYMTQMAAYRRAVHMLAKIPLERISTHLLLTRTRSIVAMSEIR